MIIAPRCLVALLLTLSVFPPPSIRAADELDARIKEVLARPQYQHSRWGLLVVDADSGKEIFQHNPDARFAPASVTKLFTCAAALIEFGADHRFRTPVYRRGQVIEGTLRGDLILVAKGDPTLGGRTDASGHLVFKDNDHTYASSTSTSAQLTDTDPLGGLRTLARQVRECGIRQIEGEVLIDNRLYVTSPASGSGPKQVTPIIVNDNVLDVIVTPAESIGEQATARIRPENDFSHVDVKVQTVARDAKPRISVELVGPDRYVLRGRIPLGSKPLVRICPVADPVLFARGLFIEALHREGVRVKTTPLRPPQASSLPEPDAYGGLTRVALYESPPLAELLKITLKVSHNLYASALPLLIAAKHGRRTLAEGMALEGRILAESGIAVKDIALESGAGGGDCDRLTPRAAVQLLRALSRRPDFPVYRAALPVLGVDGTLVSVVSKDSPARGKVLAKTGTYTDSDLLNDRVFLRSKSLAGVMTTREGRRLVFAMFVNDVPLPRGVDSSREGKTLGELCEILYGHSFGDTGGR
ncbi:MAG TPA: D-alanyl-D-alanine carboxypeptidase/D-alanyl-D-alanine-endopeptidase [Gemmataceae bacterium]|jgi:D-alanyl-D-alanine carboxypeptidase/D-alanyl-D-alanine-endopeptidase (penicillin-binding protein 4)